MKYQSTRENSPLLDFDQAVFQGLAPDGGLYVPQEFPHFKVEELKDLFQNTHSPQDLIASAYTYLLKAFAPRIWNEQELRQMSSTLAQIPTPLISLTPTLSLLKLDQGPTAAFKDVGAHALAQCLSLKATRPYTILVATSGDTGAAVASAFWKHPLAQVVILFPKDRVSPMQKAQLTRFGENIRSFEVDGSFDECQKLVKEAFLDREFCTQHALTSANSINLGRLIPQMSYYLTTALIQKYQHKKAVRFMIPSGNLGNATAALWVQKCAPFLIDEIALSFNANQVVPQALHTLKYHPQDSIKTLANAMDVGRPSNWERLLFTFGSIQKIQNQVRAFSTSDKDIAFAMKHAFDQTQNLLCPHTATSYFHIDQEQRKNLNKKQQDWICVATAHPAKFPEITEQVLQRKAPPPPSLERLLKRPPLFSSLHTPTLLALKNALS